MTKFLLGIIVGYFFSDEIDGFLSKSMTSGDKPPTKPSTTSESVSDFEGPAKPPTNQSPPTPNPVTPPITN